MARIAHALTPTSAATEVHQESRNRCPPPAIPRRKARTLGERAARNWRLHRVLLPDPIETVRTKKGHQPPTLAKHCLHDLKHVASLLTDRCSLALSAAGSITVPSEGHPTPYYLCRHPVFAFPRPAPVTGPVAPCTDPLGVLVGRSDGAHDRPLRLGYCLGPMLHINDLTYRIEGRAIFDQASD